MGDVYRVKEDVLMCYQYGLHYIGFENGSETQINKEDVRLYDNEIKVGDKITGFDSGTQRTSFLVDDGYMTYMGTFGNDLLFEIYDPQEPPQQQRLFEQRPVWLLAFTYVGEYGGLLMFTQPGAGYDIKPSKILKYDAHRF